MRCGGFDRTEHICHRGHVAEHGGQCGWRLLGPEPVQHGGRCVEADDLESRGGQGDGEPTGADAEFTDRTVTGERDEGGDLGVGVEHVGVPLVVHIGEGVPVERGVVGHRHSLPAPTGTLWRVSAYLDHAATGPMRPDAVEAMLPMLTERFANPSGAHRWARDARRAIDEARDELAELLGAAPGDIIYTSGGTEADNLAVFGAGRLAEPQPGHGRPGIVVCSAIEHHAVLDPVEHLGGRVVGVDPAGCIDLDALSEVLREETERAEAGQGPGVRLVSVMAVNNEIGTIQPLDRVAKLVRRHAPGALLHSDAVQAFCWTDVARLTRDADLVTVSGHKFGGPKGIGALVARPDAAVHAVQIGGGQERGRRSGTQNVAGIVAMTVAARAAAAEREAERSRLGALRDRLIDGLLATVPDIVETAATDRDGVSDRSHRAAGIAHVCIAGIESEALLFLLERQEVFASAASSCSSGAMEPSHVLAAIGVDPELAKGSLRLSLGWTTTEDQIDHALAVIPAAVAQLRRFSIGS